MAPWIFVDTVLWTQTYPVDNTSLIFPTNYRFFKSFNVKNSKSGKRKNLILDLDYVNINEYRTFVRHAKGHDHQMEAYNKIQGQVQEIKLRRLPSKEEEAEIDKLVKNHWSEITAKRFGRQWV